MKKIIKFLMLLLLPLTPIISNAEECTKEQLNQFQNQVENIKINVDYNLKAEVEYGAVPDEMEKSASQKGTFTVEIENLTDNFYVNFSDGIDTFTFDKNNNKWAGIYGNIYEVTIKNDYCENDLKKYELYLPTYNPNNNKVWNDRSVNLSNEEENNKINLGLLLILIIILIAFVFSIFVLLKNRKVRLANNG